MRVILLTQHYPRWAGDARAAELSSLVRALIRRGISVRVVAAGERTAEGQIDGVPVRWVKATGRDGAPEHESPNAAAVPIRWTHLARLWPALRRAARLELARGADLVHAHGWVPAGAAAPPKLPLVLTVQEPDGGVLRRSRFAARLAAPLLRRAAVVTAVSRQIGELVQKVAGRFVEPGHIHRLPLDSRGLPWTRGGQGAVVMSRLDPPGRVELALETSSLLASHGHQLSLTIIGDGPNRTLLEQRAARLGISALTKFLGDLPSDQARNHLLRADLALVTGRGDATGRPALEALIAGVPVVACWDSGGAVEVVPESGAGRLCLPSPEVMAECVLSLLADRDRLPMGRLVGEAWRARLAPDHVAELCAGWYRDAIAR